ncbi:CDP-alcohol phosphatidyltransferase family protein, partial [Mycobacterium sp.]|uniref:CDP-alcohol phosphatidyltransferase family protein n=1 Tax=Mycobacterium sp. TaxID=1785 RepID=UPI003C74735A
MTTATNQAHITLRFLPSAMTVAAISLGLTAVKYAQDRSLSIESRATWAMALLVLAAVLDALDGRVARVLNATSRMGEEIDSLADAVNFGVVPAFIVYAILLQDAPNPNAGWLVVVLYAACI